MAKFSNDDEPTLGQAVRILATVAPNAMKQKTARNALVDRFSLLEDYDTVFLIDDSPSMRGEKWELVQKILIYSVAVAARYDPDGVDIHFMNNSWANQDNFKDYKIVTDLHHDIELRGSTPTLARLSRHLRSYYQRFRPAGFSPDFKGYNLIVLTDGEPDAEYDDESEDESDMPDQDDAREHKAAFRLIRREIVRIAKKLDEVDAQPGNDRDAIEFLHYVDHRTKGKNNLHRDVSSRVFHIDTCLKLWY